MSDEYRIETLADMLAVPRDRWDALLADLRAWMDFTADKATALADRVGDELDCEVTVMRCMSWRDDDIVGFNGEVAVHVMLDDAKRGAEG